MTTIAFFNNKGGVGKTSLVFHLAWKFKELGHNVVAADLDPQANLSSMFLDEEILEKLWPDKNIHRSILGSISPIIRGTGDIGDSYVHDISGNLGLIVGDLGLSTFEDSLSYNWAQCSDGKEAAFRTISAFFRLLLQASRKRDADLVLIDVGPNLGAINRAAIIAADYVVVPLGPDLFSLQGLRNLGPTLKAWRSQWRDRRRKNPEPELELPKADIRPLVYIVMQHAVRLDRPVKAYQRWIDRIPDEYRSSVLDRPEKAVPTVEKDPHCLAQLKHYRSLMPLAMDARKPMFELKPADGAIGAHQAAVQRCDQDFTKLAASILSKIAQSASRFAAE